MGKYDRQERYAQAHQLHPKAYKLYKPITDAFAETCKRLNLKQAPTLQKLMEAFIEEHKEEKE